MKKTFFPHGALILFCLSCNNIIFVEPQFTLVYYNFLNNEGFDFFSANSNYSKAKLSALDDSGKKREIVWEGNFNEVNYFKTYPWHTSPLYIDFGNGDLDTLITIVEPQHYNPITEFENLERVRFYFNGELIEDWDFIKNPNLKDSITYLNTEVISSDLPLPVPIIIPKEEDPDELKGG